nr:pilus assembly protein [uncultured Eisenbergiella sp.]
MPLLYECNVKRNYKQYNRKVMYFRTHFPHTYKKLHTFTYPLTHPAKGVSLPASCQDGTLCRHYPGSMTVEASLAVPLFLFFMVNILSMNLFFHTFAQNLETLHQQGRQLSMLAYTTGAPDEMIQLVRPARVKPVVPILSYPGTTIVSCCYMRAWTGYDVERKTEAEEQEEIVYITENGTVYHRERNCTHLTFSVELAGRDEVGQLRNESGGKYYPCEKCGGDGSSFVYVTGEGSRYHNTITCSGLKRTVISIPLSEAGGRPPCSRCG